MAKVLIALTLFLLAGCTYTISLIVNLPGDSTPTVVEPQVPQPQHDSFNL